MKSLNQYIKEKLIINKDYVDVNMLTPKSFDELRKIIEDRYDKLGPGPNKKNPIDFNDIDVSNINSFCGKYNKGLFDDMNFRHIDISNWDVSNVTNMSHMFCRCSNLKSVGDLSKWNVSKVTDMSDMFFCCAKLKSVVDISKWDVSNVTDMHNMFEGCEKFNQDISGWDVSSVTNMSYMFNCCENFNKDISSWDVSKVQYNLSMFRRCPIKEEYKPKFK